ncbi:MAG: phosphate signaling complex protein PhoU [Armatimonadota bacterium]|nr:phosphate signaling complex protein PhoU [Armatimonadota bacterium]
MLTGDRHIRGAFDQALQRLEDDILRMGRTVGDLLRRAVEALMAHDVAAAVAVIEADDAVDDEHLRLEHRIVALLATQQPMARDLRTLASLLVTTIDLERMADHAEGIADAARRLRDASLVEPLVQIAYMDTLVRGMLHDVLEALARRDPVLAEAVAARDDTVDALRAQVFRVMLTYMAENPRRLSEAIDLIVVAQHLERSADHVTNVAERVVYMATGRLKVLNPETARP